MSQIIPWIKSSRVGEPAIESCHPETCCLGDVLCGSLRILPEDRPADIEETARIPCSIAAQCLPLHPRYIWRIF
jgi:hypothetical protein